MENVIEALKIFLPCLVVGAVAYFLVKSFLDYENDRAKLQAQNVKLEIVVPARMQAYERIVLFLERITPDNLIRRTLNVTTSARVFHTDLVSAIRNEYEHNLSQQVYISPAAWAMVKTATEETLRLVNISASKLPNTALATDLAQSILNITSQIGKFPTHVAIDNIKKEFAQYFFDPSQGKKEETKNY